MQLDHLHLLYQCKPNLSLVCFFHFLNLNFYVSNHPNKVHLCRVDMFVQNFRVIYYHMNVRWVTNCSFVLKCCLEWYCS